LLGNTNISVQSTYVAMDQSSTFEKVFARKYNDFCTGQLFQW
jgi:hypothetical protein